VAKGLNENNAVFIDRENGHSGDQCIGMNSRCHDEIVRNFAVVGVGNMIGVNKEFRVLENGSSLFEDDFRGISRIVQNASISDPSMIRYNPATP
jgi:hypothetical protein